jgi:magnesium chelatase family protein
VSDDIKKRVEIVREVQLNRFRGEGITLNAKMNNILVKKHCKLDHSCTDLLDSAVRKMNLTSRSVYKILKVARTIADMNEAGVIAPTHLAESIQYKLI